MLTEITGITSVVIKNPAGYRSPRLEQYLTNARARRLPDGSYELETDSHATVVFALRLLTSDDGKTGLVVYSRSSSGEARHEFV